MSCVEKDKGGYMSEPVCNLAGPGSKTERGHMWAWRNGLASLAPFAGYSGLSLIYDALPPVLVEIARHFGGGATGQSVAQLASSVPFFGVMVGGLIAGSIILRYGVKLPLLAALTIFGVSGSAGYFIDQAWLLICSRALLGFAVGVMMTCGSSDVALRYDDVGKARFSGWLLAWGCFTGIFFVLIAGYVATAFSWRAPFILHLVVALAFLLPTLAMGKASVCKKPQPLLADLERLKPAWPVYVTAVTLFSIQTMFFFQSSFLLTEAGFGSPALIGWIFAMTGVSATIAAFAFGQFSAKISPVRSVKFGLAMFGCGIALTACSHSLPAFVVSLCVYSGGSALTQASLFARIMQVCPANLAPRALGFVTTSLYFGGSIGPVIVAPLLWYLDLRVLFLLLASIVALWLSGAAIRSRMA
jgi:MFS family permease